MSSCSAGSPAPLTEPQSAWNVRLGRRTEGLDLDVLSAEANTQMADKCTKVRISRPKCEKVMRMASPNSSFIPYPHMLSRLRRFYSCEPPPNPNPGPALVDVSTFRVRIPLTSERLRRQSSTACPRRSLIGDAKQFYQLLPVRQFVHVGKPWCCTCIY